LNAQYEHEFISWIETFATQRNKINAMPYGFGSWYEPDCDIICSQRHIIEDEEDERLGDC
jgi:hypothetical protein